MRKAPKLDNNQRGVLETLDNNSAIVNAIKSAAESRLECVFWIAVTRHPIAEHVVSMDKVVYVVLLALQLRKVNSRLVHLSSGMLRKGECHAPNRTTRFTEIHLTASLLGCKFHSNARPW